MRPIFLLPLAALAACSVSDAAGRRDDGSGATRDYALSGFDRVELKGSDDVDVRVGPAFRVRAQASPALLDRLEIVVERGVLKVGRRSDAWNWGGDHGHARVTVTLPRLAGTSVAGSGDMTVDRVAGGDFAGNVSGSGNLALAAVDTRAVRLGVTGSGGITAKGRAAQGDYTVTGSGGIDAKALETATLAASLAGSGSIVARASGTAKISVVGSGDVTVTGGARCDVRRTGSGDAHCG